MSMINVMIILIFSLVLCGSICVIAKKCRNQDPTETAIIQTNDGKTYFIPGNNLKFNTYYNDEINVSSNGRSIFYLKNPEEQPYRAWIVEYEYANNCKDILEGEIQNNGTKL